MSLKKFPLHHCCAIGCDALIDPNEIMCKPHWNQVSIYTMAILVAPRNAWQRLQAVNLAMLEVAVAEGRAKLLTPDASQAKPNTPSVPGDADPRKESL